MKIRFQLFSLSLSRPFFRRGIEGEWKFTFFLYFSPLSFSRSLFFKKLLFNYFKLVFFSRDDKHLDRTSPFFAFLLHPPLLVSLYPLSLLFSRKAPGLHNMQYIGRIILVHWVILHIFHDSKSSYSSIHGLPFPLSSYSFILSFLILILSFQVDTLLLFEITIKAYLYSLLPSFSIFPF